MSYIYQHTQDRINGLATFNFVTISGKEHKFKISTQLIGALVERGLDDGVVMMRDAEGREKYNRIIETIVDGYTII